ncbi:MAG: hypothetical protein LUF04_16240 [Bacteroides sp.]|nr:hypothetical protein [Bacteroides sp.]
MCLGLLVLAGIQVAAAEKARTHSDVIQVDLPDNTPTIQTLAPADFSPGELAPVSICQLLLPAEVNGEYTALVQEGLKGEDYRQRFDQVNIGYTKYRHTGWGHKCQC